MGGEVWSDLTTDLDQCRQTESKEPFPVHLFSHPNTITVYGKYKV